MTSSSSGAATSVVLALPPGRFTLRAHGPGTQSPVLMADTALSISSFAEGQDGSLYVVEIGGDVWKVIAQAR